MSINYLVIMPLLIALVCGVIILLYYLDSTGLIRLSFKSKDNLVYKYMEKNVQNYSIDFVEHCALNLNLSKSNKEFLLSCASKDNKKKDTTWYDDGSFEKDLINKRFFCAGICDIIIHKKEIINFLNKNENFNLCEEYNLVKTYDVNFLKDLRDIDVFDLTSLNKEYISIKKRFYIKELVFVLLFFENINFEILYKEYLAKPRYSFIVLLSKLVQNEMSFQEDLTSFGSIDETINNININNHLDIPIVLFRSLNYCYNGMTNELNMDDVQRWYLHSIISKQKIFMSQKY